MLPAAHTGGRALGIIGIQLVGCAWLCSCLPGLLVVCCSRLAGGIFVDSTLPSNSDARGVAAVAPAWFMAVD